MIDSLSLGFTDLIFTVAIFLGHLVVDSDFLAGLTDAFRGLKRQISVASKRIRHYAWRGRLFCHVGV